MAAHVLNSIGLVLGMAGVLLIFVWGPPQPSFEEGVSLGVTPATVLADGTKVADIIAEQKRKKRRHQAMSRLGLALIFFGFFCQLGATWI